MRIMRVTEPDKLKELYKWRYEVYVNDLAWFSPDPNRGNVWEDEFDAKAHNYAAYDNNETIVGSVRVVFDSNSLGLPLEAGLSTDTEHRSLLNTLRKNKNIAEICRLAVNCSYRGSHLGCLLMKTALECCIQEARVNHVIADGVGQAAAIYEKLHLFSYLGEPFVDYNYNDNPICRLFETDIYNAIKNLSHNSPALYKFFTNKDERISHGQPIFTQCALHK